MSTEADKLARVGADVDEVMRKMEVGSVDRQRSVRRIDLAMLRNKDFVREHQPSGETRGGSSSVVASEDASEEARMSRQASADLVRVPDIIDQMERLSRELALAVTRAVVTIDPDDVPIENVIPGCLSCARKRYRKGRKVGGHFAAIREDVKGHRLCDWCYRHALAVAKEKKDRIKPEYWPPLEACDIYHRQGAQAAGRWLAQQAQRGAA